MVIEKITASTAIAGAVASIAVPTIVDTVKHFYYIEQTKKAIDDVLSLGKIIYFDGKIRKGKTSVCLGVIHALTQKIIDTLKGKISLCIELVPSVNYNKLNDRIEELLKQRLDADAVYGAVKKDYEKYFKGRYNNGVKVIAKTKLLFDYIEAKYYLKRNNFVYSKTRIYNYITKNWSKDLKIADFNIKDRNINKDYRLDKYSVFFIDDKSLDQTNLEWQQTYASDSGRMEFLRLIGQLFEETSYYLTNMQNYSRDIPNERELITSVNAVQSMKLCITFNTTNFILEKVKGFNNYIYDLYINLFPEHKRKEMRLQKSPLKTINKNIKQLQLLLESKGYIRFIFKQYEDAKDVGKETTAFKIKKYYFPIKWTWGAMDTHEYKSVHRYLKGKSTVDYNTLDKPKTEEEKEAIVKEILKKHKVKSKNEEEREKKRKEAEAKRQAEKLAREEMQEEEREKKKQEKEAKRLANKTAHMERQEQEKLARSKRPKKALEPSLIEIEQVDTTNTKEGNLYEVK